MCILVSVCVAEPADREMIEGIVLFPYKIYMGPTPTGVVEYAWNGKGWKEFDGWGNFLKIAWGSKHTIQYFGGGVDELETEIVVVALSALEHCVLVSVWSTHPVGRPKIPILLSKSRTHSGGP